MININNARKVYKNGSTELVAIKNISFVIEEGEFIILAGPSGSGKSTLLNMLGGMDDITSGEILVGEYNIGKLSKNKLSDFRKNNVGYVFQQFNLIGSLTAYENIELPLILNKVDKKKRKEMVDCMLEEVGLYDKANNFPRDLSGGQQQRIAIARAVIFKPKMILADEPTANLDSVNGEICMDILKQLNEEYGITIIVSTHDQRIIEKSDNVIYLVDGEIANKKGQG